MVMAPLGQDHGRVSTSETTDRGRPTVRVLVVDDHPALRAGLEGLLRGEAEMQCVGAVDGSDGVLDAVHTWRPDVVVLDYALAGPDGLTLCFRLKQRADAPAVVLYSAYVDRVFAVPAAIAQADATVAKSAPVSELLLTICQVASGRRERAPLDPELIEAASARLLVDDLPVASMLLGATPVVDIADLRGLSVAEVRSRALRIIGRLQAGRRGRATTSSSPTSL
jgi:DNA-binding NarL/FixJ family response regulator